MIKEVYTREQAIAEFINNNTGFIGLLNICKYLHKHDNVFGEYVWLRQEEFNHALRNWEALDIIKATPFEFFHTADFFHINSETGKFQCASFEQLCTYFEHMYVRIQLIKYLVNCEHGHTGDEILDGIVNATSNTMFDDSFYIYHAPEERPEDYDDDDDNY